MKKYILIPLVLLALSVTAQNKNYYTRQGDKAFSVFDFRGAIDYYSVSLRKHKGDSVYLQQQVAESWRLLNQPTEAEQWYRKVANRADRPMNRFYLAEALRANQKYDEARTYYQQYQAAAPGDKNIAEILEGLDHSAELAKDKGIYRVEMVNFNSGASDFGPAYFSDGKLFFTSNRNGKRDNNLTDNWSSHNYYQIFIAQPQSQGATTYDVKKVKKCKPNGRFHDGPVAYYGPTSELIFTRSNYVNATSKAAADKKTVHLELYSMTFSEKKRSKIHALPANDKNYSSAHPALTADGKTLYFSSDRPGGLGGTDLYMCTRPTVTSPWSAPVSLGTDINSKYDEKFPFIGGDGTLYFASDALGGLGGLDIYKTKNENSKWSKPENMGYPINTNRDDFSLIMDSSLTHGFFSSNRSGGMGDDDIYSFSVSKPKTYNVSVKVIDAVTKEPIADAGLALDCPQATTQRDASNALGMHDYTLPAGKSCSVAASKDGYNNASAPLSQADKNGIVTIPLTPKAFKLIAYVKDKETLEPIAEVGLDVTPSAQPSLTYTTDAGGHTESELAMGSYAITSPQYASIQSSFSTADADPATGIVTREFLVERGSLKVTVPLTANCFSHTVAYTDLKTGVRKEVQPNKEMLVRLDLALNKKYTIEHNGRTDTISTVGLKPGQTIDGPCKFYVGQTWVINNIYYDLDKSFIRPDAAKELDNVVRVMRENPTLEIELSSHTDCRQTYSYNEQLSVRRARAAVAYIESKRIRMNRMIAAGYGETRLVNGCACEPTNKSDCTEPQHSKNRRTEIKVLKY